MLAWEVVIDLSGLSATLDLWSCMWDTVEQNRFEAALMRCLTEAHSRPTRMVAFAACNVIATPRLLAAARRAVDRGLLQPDASSAIEGQTAPLYELMAAAARLRGNCARVEVLLRLVLSGEAAPGESRVLDWVDVRDLVAVARTTVDARIYAEVERRVARRGKYQRGRAAHLLGFRVLTSSSAAAHAA
jgi:hypothetical protein